MAAPCRRSAHRHVTSNTTTHTCVISDTILSPSCVSFQVVMCWQPPAGVTLIDTLQETQPQQQQQQPQQQRNGQAKGGQEKEGNQNGGDEKGKGRGKGKENEGENGEGEERGRQAVRGRGRGAFEFICLLVCMPILFLRARVM